MKRWYVKASQEDIAALAQETRIHPVLVRLMVNRGIAKEDFHKFLHPSFDNSCHDPFLMKGVKEALELIIRTAQGQGKIRIVGDYDQDGNSATMTLLDGLGVLTKNLDYDIPHRVEDGYGISKGMIDRAKEEGVSLIITCDNGIAAIEEVAYAKDLGLDIIVTDHHEPVVEEGREVLPAADAVINPKQENCPYPFKELCGAGVAFKLVQALFKLMKEDSHYLYLLLEYVAMGTVCDVVDLVDENRLFVQQGLKRLNRTENYGIQALVRESGLKSEITTYSLGYVLGPAINASGRLDTAKWGVELFSEENMDKVDDIAKKLVALNTQRKQMTEEGLAKVRQQVLDQGLQEDPVIVVVETSLHESIAGIIAGRIKDEFYRPTLVLTASQEAGVLKGSGRSIPEYHLFDKVHQARDHLRRFGGHQMAAGLSIDETQVAAFRQQLIQEAGLGPEDLVEKIYIDTSLHADVISFDLIEEINKLEPFGKGNPRPKFGDKGAVIERISIIGKGENVLKLDLNIRGRTLEAIKFQAEKDIDYLKEKLGAKAFAQLIVGLPVENSIDIIYYPKINEFRQVKKVQLNLIDLR